MTTTTRGDGLACRLPQVGASPSQSSTRRHARAVVPPLHITQPPECSPPPSVFGNINPGSSTRHVREGRHFSSAKDSPPAGAAVEPPHPGFSSSSSSSSSSSGQSKKVFSAGSPKRLSGGPGPPRCHDVGGSPGTRGAHPSQKPIALPRSPRNADPDEYDADEDLRPSASEVEKMKELQQVPDGKKANPFSDAHPVFNLAEGQLVWSTVGSMVLAAELTHLKKLIGEKLHYRNKQLLRELHCLREILHDFREQNDSFLEKRELEAKEKENLLRCPGRDMTIEKCLSAVDALRRIAQEHRVPLASVLPQSDPQSLTFLLNFSDLQQGRGSSRPSTARRMNTSRPSTSASTRPSTGKPQHMKGKLSSSSTTADLSASATSTTEDNSTFSVRPAVDDKSTSADLDDRGSEEADDHTQQELFSSRTGASASDTVVGTVVVENDNINSVASASTSTLSPTKSEASNQVFDEVQLECLAKSVRTALEEEHLQLVKAIAVVQKELDEELSYRDDTVKRMRAHDSVTLVTTDRLQTFSLALGEAVRLGSLESPVFTGLSKQSSSQRLRSLVTSLRSTSSGTASAAQGQGAQKAASSVVVEKGRLRLLPVDELLDSASSSSREAKSAVVGSEEATKTSKPDDLTAVLARSAGVEDDLASFFFA